MHSPFVLAEKTLGAPNFASHGPTRTRREGAGRAIAGVPAGSWALKRQAVPRWREEARRAIGGPFLAKSRYHIACGRRKTASSPVWDLFVRLQKPLLNDGYAARRSICAFSAVEGMWSTTRPNFRVAVVLKYRSNAHDVVEGTYADDPGPIGSLRKLLGGR
ncbi:hypothetical protein EMIHUDRAFT_221398 [Emiliania huxleyi CCMP1516]|uniref:Uncharacterized protein n=2 Tax=Emiliania huxleyi TaxID=2903 RepID=A0A0D3HZ19_EMIH1|nr:hypothetical protein EMIHUDRAFT_221398 [Emiliania huxleyi CCMP1516]EOD04254.1 hypothetical protein EMIHUDRAFT_221398 [Emiliania huxleyi CCMP1516]|eukprot:XP_005756683.1 hypothetical protein EMIHUDRAFT_221398 [Emiliania huxleyi CCMP1516]